MESQSYVRYNETQVLFVEFAVVETGQWCIIWKIDQWHIGAFVDDHFAVLFSGIVLIECCN